MTSLQWLMINWWLPYVYCFNLFSKIGFTSSGQPLTKEEFIARVRESHATGKEGKVKTTAELLAEIQTWTS